MNVKEKLLMDADGLREHGAVNIVILGDSVSHGALCGTIDYEHVYWNRLKQRLNAWRDYVPVNMICSAISGSTATSSLPRLESQVLKHEPDLVIVCFGLNDINGTLDEYLNSLREIFTRCQAVADVVFLTPNMLNPRVADDTPTQHYDYAVATARMQNEGRMDAYIDAAKALAAELGVPVCDGYAAWKQLAKTQDITSLLANRINHPTAEMHELFANLLYDYLIGDGTNTAKTESTMFQ
jgi:lysophospholipase L1-like esterase